MSTGPAECSGFTPPASGVFPTGYCIFKLEGGIPVPVGTSQCKSGFQCPDVRGVFARVRERIKNGTLVEGECFAVECVPLTTGFSPSWGAGSRPGAGFDPDDQEAV